MDPVSARVEAERCLGIAVKLLTARDFHGSKKYAIRARDSDPNNSISDQILAVVETVLAGENRVNPSQHPDWYTVLQLPRLVRDPDLIADHYRRLVLLLNPDSNRFPFSDYALKLVMDAWSILSDPNKKWVFDNELAVFIQSQQQPPPPPQQPPLSESASQVNIFQFFQQPSVVQQPVSIGGGGGAVPTWQQQQQSQNHQNNSSSSNNNNNNNNQLNQIEFMQPQQSQQPPQPQQQPVAQWQKRDLTPPRVSDAVPSVVVVQTPTRAMPPIPAPAAPAVNSSNNVVINHNNNVDVDVSDDDDDDNVGDNDIVDVDVDVDSDNDVDDDDCEEEDDEEEQVESFWTSCPYCLYTYEYQKMYQDCTLRCSNCRRGFHAAQIPNPPPFGGGKGKGKGKETNFCCWGFYPLGFSTAAWKNRA